MKNKELEIALTTYIAFKHNQDECSGFIDGYKQCQEDNKDKKYTEEDVFKVWLRCRVHSDEQQVSYELFKNFINSLNKQD